MELGVNMRSLDTDVLYKGTAPSLPEKNPEALPVYTASAYAVDDLDDYEFASRGGRYYYTREVSANKDCAGEVISFLEGGAQTLLTASGMGAISVTMFGLLAAGDHVLINKAIYSEVVDITQEFFDKLGIAYGFADFTDIAAVKAAVRPETKMLYTEVISNPHTNVVDLDAVSAVAKAQGAYLVVDSTFSTPVVIRPLAHGADVVIHSLTKFMGGHHDLIGGSVTASEEIIGRLWRTYCLLGSCLDPRAAWLLSRSLKTFVIRAKKQIDNAEIIAKALLEDPHVVKVNHPSLPSHPQHEAAERQFDYGYGAMLSFEVCCDEREKLNVFFRALKLVKYVGSLGGVTTTVTHPRTAFVHEFGPEKLDEMGLTPNLIRISAGIEDPEDVIADIRQALGALEGGER